MAKFNLFQPAAPKVGRWTWADPTSFRAGQAGQPSPLDASQRRLPGERTPQGIYPDGLPRETITREFSRGAARTVQDFGKVLYNPIGSGVYARSRPKPYYGKPAKYEGGAIWWTAQSTPTSVKLTGLQDPAALAAILGPNYVQAAIRTTV